MATIKKGVTSIIMELGDVISQLAVYIFGRNVDILSHWYRRNMWIVYVQQTVSYTYEIEQSLRI